MKFYFLLSFLQQFLCQKETYCKEDGAARTNYFTQNAYATFALQELRNSTRSHFQEQGYKFG